MMDDAVECEPIGHGADGVHKAVEDDVITDAVMGYDHSGPGGTKATATCSLGRSACAINRLHTQARCGLRCSVSRDCARAGRAVGARRAVTRQMPAAAHHRRLRHRPAALAAVPHHLRHPRWRHTTALPAERWCHTAAGFGGAVTPRLACANGGVTPTPTAASGGVTPPRQPIRDGVRPLPAPEVVSHPCRTAAGMVCTTAGPGGGVTPLPASASGGLDTISTQIH